MPGKDEYIDIRLRLKDARKFNSEMQGAGGAVDKFGNKVQRTAAKSSLLNRASGVAAKGVQAVTRAAKYGALAVSGLAAVYAKKSINTTVSLAKSTLLLSRNFGMSTEAASSLSSVANVYGVDIKQLNMGLTTLSKNTLSANQGGKKQLRLFKMMHIGTGDLRKAHRDFLPFLTKVFKGLGNLPKGYKKAAVAQQLMGRGAIALNPLMADQGKALTDNMDLAAKYGATFGDTTLDRVKNFMKAQKVMKYAMLGLQIQFATLVIPILTKSLKKIAGWVSSIQKLFNRKDLTGEQKWNKFGDMVSNALEKALPQIASKAGQIAPKIAAAFVKGFIHADAWGKLAMGAFLISRFVGWRVIFKTVGRRCALWFMAAFVPRMVAGAAWAAIATSRFGLLGGAARAQFALAGTKLGAIFSAALTVAMVAAVAAAGYLALRELEKITGRGNLGFGNDRDPIVGGSGERYIQQLKGQGWTNLRLTGGGRKVTGLDPHHHTKTRKIPPGMYRGGTISRSGMRMVGERGKELEFSQPGATVIPLPPRMQRSASQAIDLSPLTGRGRETTIPVVVNIDGKKVAMTVVKHVEDAEARG